MESLQTLVGHENQVIATKINGTKYLAEMIMDSEIGGRRLICLRITYPRFVHAEVLRHRNMSICSASSRALPLMRMIKQFGGFTPRKWRKHQPGMQPNESHAFSEEEIAEFDKVWGASETLMGVNAQYLHSKGVAKELVNRMIETYSYVTHLFQGTVEDFQAFFKLRLPVSAQFEVRDIAELANALINDSKPTTRLIHAPFYTIPDLINKEELMNILYCSSARCARTSFFNHDGKEPTVEEDLTLAQSLEKDEHESPFEFPVIDVDYAKYFFRDIDFFEILDEKRIIAGSLGDPILVKKDFSGNIKDYNLFQFRSYLKEKKKKC